MCHVDTIMRCMSYLYRTKPVEIRAKLQIEKPLKGVCQTVTSQPQSLVPCGRMIYLRALLTLDRNVILVYNMNLNLLKVSN